MQMKISKIYVCFCLLVPKILCLTTFLTTLLWILAKFDENAKQKVSKSDIQQSKIILENYTPVQRKITSPRKLSSDETKQRGMYIFRFLLYCCNY
jgi:hypothetical protein